MSDYPEIIKAPFPWFGGKSRIADVVWERLGDVPNYVEPFFGSGAVLLARPPGIEGRCETVNDLDGMVANFWRALRTDPSRVAHYADWPVNENDLHARHAWLVGQKDSLQAHLEGDPDFYDAKIAGWWCWGICCWIGSGFCSGEGPWQVIDEQLVHLWDKGRGVNRQLVHLGNKGQGVNRKRPTLSHMGKGTNQPTAVGNLTEWFTALSERLRRVRVCCGDWSRVCTPTPTVKQGLTGVFLDPPYSESAGRTVNLYRKDCLNVAQDVREWGVERGDDPRMRIALCGYEGEHEMPDSWQCVAWKGAGGYGSQGDSRARTNTYRERIWFSPYCLKPDSIRNTAQMSLELEA